MDYPTCNICDNEIDYTQDMVSCKNKCRYHKKCFKNLAKHDSLYINVPYKKVPCDCDCQIEVIPGMSSW